MYVYSISDTALQYPMNEKSRIYYFKNISYIKYWYLE